MTFVGMFALGIFVGGVATVGLKQATTSLNSYLSITGALIAIAFGGGVLGFANKLQGLMGQQTDALFMYPIGLLVALIWLYFPEVFGQPNRFIRWGGVVSMVAITLLGTALAMLPGFRSVLR